MVTRTPPTKIKAAPVQKYFKGDDARLSDDIIPVEGAILPKGQVVTILDVDNIGRTFNYLVELLGSERTAWVLEYELEPNRR
jgi:hypothetical protein